MKSRSSIGIAALAMATAVAMPAMAQVNNGGFENPPTVPVTPNDWQYNGAGAGRDGSFVHGGLFSANLNNVSEASNANVLQQTAFGSITPGVTYTLDFWAAGSYGVGGIGQAQIGFMNSVGGLLPGSPVFINIPSSASYTEFTQPFTAPTNASALFLAFNAVTGAVTGSTSHLYVDDVKFAPVPEPTSLAIVAVGGMMLGRRRRV